MGTPVRIEFDVEHGSDEGQPYVAGGVILTLRASGWNVRLAPMRKQGDAPVALQVGDRVRTFLKKDVWVVPFGFDSTALRR
jgi:hypothetical protein